MDEEDDYEEFAGYTHINDRAKKAKKAPPAVFLKENWSSLLASFTSEFVSHARRNNVALVNPHSAATAEDRAALATVCFWSNNKKGGYFLHFTNSMVHCVGRGSEIAATRVSNVKTVMCDELLN
jgi:hypothetical protein